MIKVMKNGKNSQKRSKNAHFCTSSTILCTFMHKCNGLKVRKLIPQKCRFVHFVHQFIKLSMRVRVRMCMCAHMGSLCVLMHKCTIILFIYL